MVASAAMLRTLQTTIFLATIGLAGSVATAQRPPFTPVTGEMLVKPSPDDWLMYSRTYDAQRFSPLRQITRANVGKLQEVFKKELGTGTIEGIPIVYRGVMYLMTPGASVQALDAATGALIWEHRRPAGASRVKTLAIYEDMVYYPSPDGFIVALDARTGEVRWETKTTGGMTAGSVVIEGKVLTGRTCAPRRENCYISAHDAKTGAELWRFYTAAGSNEPGGDTWGGAPDETRAASTWGLPGGYDPVRRLVYWGVANPTPNTRADRHGGNSAAIPVQSPADLYSNSTIALHIDTGKLAWYYQHLPGDDWDEDYPARAHADPRRRASGPQVRQVDQPRRPPRRDARDRPDGGRGRRRVGAGPADRPVPLGQPVPLRHPELPDLEHRRQDRARGAEQERHVQRSAGPQGHLLLEHPQLLADGVSSRPERALRAVCRELPGHDHGRARTGRRPNAASGFRARAPTPTPGRA